MSRFVEERIVYACSESLKGKWFTMQASADWSKTWPSASAWAGAATPGSYCSKKSTHYYRAHRRDHRPTWARLRELAQVRQGWGCGRLNILPRREGWLVNRQRTAPDLPGRKGSRCGPGLARSAGATFASSDHGNERTVGHGLRAGPVAQRRALLGGDLGGHDCAALPRHRRGHVA